MSKAVLVCRVSTTSQELDEQRDELVAYAKSKGYHENDQIIIEAIGASAIKLDKKYLDMAQKAKDLIKADKDIDALFVWELSRLGRNEVILMDFKQFFIDNRIQFYCMNPTLQLLNLDGSVNSGTELAFSLFATMSVQEMRNKAARFKRAKKANSENHKWNGGFSAKYGYRIDKDGFIVPDPEDSKVVKEIFELYSTGLYSSRTLALELQARGIEPSRNSLLTPEHEHCRKAWVFQPDTIMRILSDTAYIGWTDDDEQHSHRKYIPIISQDLWDKVAEVRDKNYLHIPRTNKIQVAQKIIKCPLCGHKLFNDGNHYACHYHRHNSRFGGTCDYSIAIKAKIADGLVWLTAHRCEEDESKVMTKEKQKEIRETIKVIAQKQYTLKLQLEKQDEKKKKIVDAYLDDLISKEERDRRLKSLARTMSEYQEQINQYEEQLDAIRKKPESGPLNLPDTLSLITDEESLKRAQKVARKHIESCITTIESYGKRDPRAKKGNAYHFIVKTYLLGEYHYMYFPRKYQGHQFYNYDQDTQKITTPIKGL